jgi:hypothetical protein
VVTVSGVSGPPAATVSATFVKIDTTRQGSWIGAYGTNGYSLALGASQLPSYARVSVAGGNTRLWADTTSDLRALQKPTGGRFAAAWYGNVFNIDVDLVDGLEHQIGLYILDWTRRGRAETIDILNAATGAVLESRSAASFQSGQYYVWRVKGHVKFRITKTGGSSAVVSGIFFD